MAPGATVIDPIPASLLKAELEVLPAMQRLAVIGRFSVQYARASQIPWSLQEIGRLREVTFRAAGEGTGNSADIDLYDSYYLHLWIWDHEAEMIVGAYRMGRTDEIVARYGLDALYTQSLFKFGRTLLRVLDPAIELGRSFVRQEYQRSFAPLMLLWRGIGLYMAREPRYAVLFGAVSISNSYTQASRRLMVEFLTENNSDDRLARLVKPRSPFRHGRWRGVLRHGELKDIDQVSRLIESMEPDRKGIPVLLRQYLKLGGRLLAFSADEEFSDVLDGLMVCDLRNSDLKILAKYMGEEGVQRFRVQHTQGESAYPLAS